MNNCAVRLAACRKSHHDILCEITYLKERLEKIRCSPPHCYCSAVVYWSKVKALEKEIGEWEALAKEESDEIFRLEDAVKSERSMIK